MARRPHGVVYGLLAASLALNLVGAGYVGYDAFRPKPPRTVESTIDYVSARYPDAVGAAVRTQLEARRADLTRTLADMKAARRETRAAMGGEPLDPARVDRAFSDARAKAADFQTVIHGAIVAAIPDLPARERAKVVKSDKD